MVINSSNEQNLKDLAYKVKKSNGLILFLGAGFSMLAGLPSFSYLIKKIKLKITTNYLVDMLDDLDGGLETFVNALRFQKDKFAKDRNILVNILKEELRIKDIHVETTRIILEYLLCLPIKCVITTNYDELIETTLPLLGKKFAMTNKFEYQSFSKLVAINEKMPLIKIHGDIDNDDLTNLIFGYKDKSLNIKEEDRSAFIDILSFLIAQYPILFIGYSFKDNFTDSIINKVNFLTSQENIFAIIKTDDNNLNDDNIKKIITIKTPDFKINSYESVIEKMFYYYYSNAIEDSILKYDLERLKKKLLLDFNEFIINFNYKKGLFQSLSYVLYYSDDYADLIEIYDKTQKIFLLNSGKISNNTIIDFKYFEIYRLLVSHSLQDLSINEIMDKFDDLIDSIKSYKYSNYSEELFLIELTNKINYYKIVVGILGFENGFASSLDRIKESDFEIFKEPIDILTRMKIYKYQSIYFRLKKQYEKSLLKINIALYHSKYVDYKREKILIRLNEQVTLLELYNEKNNTNEILNVIKNLRIVQDDFYSINYKSGLMYACVYLYKACSLYLKLSTKIDTERTLELINFQTICKNSINRIKLKITKDNVLMLFDKIQKEFDAK